MSALLAAIAHNLSGPEPVATHLFTGNTRHAAMAGAVEWLEARGFSVGGMEGDYPRAAMFGRWMIAKWSTIDIAERRGLHARLTWADGLCTRAELLPAATPEAVAAFRRDG